MTLRAFLLFLLSLAIGCGTSTDVQQGGLDAGSLVLSGRIEFVNIETGCWVLIAEDGRHFEPSGEKARQLWKDGLLVTVRVRPLTGVASICQTGIIVEVVDIIKILEQ